MPRPKTTRDVTITKTSHTEFLNAVRNCGYCVNT